MVEITAVRHTSVDVEPGTCYGQSDVGTRDTFPEEAACTLAILKEMPSDYDAVFTSPLSRCRKLADACGYQDAIPDDRIKELNFGQWEMQRFDEITDPRLQEWYADWINVRATDGESFNDQYERVFSWLRDLESADIKKVLIFSHGGVIMQLLRISGLDDQYVFDHQPKYGEVRKIICTIQK